MLKNDNLSVSMQDYLEAILELERRANTVRITDIAIKLNIAKASVNQTITKFKELGLVRQQAYGPVELTDRGRKAAENISQRHKKLKQFLAEVLGVEDEIAEKDACMMEHAVSAQTMDRLAEFLSRNGYIKETDSGGKDVRNMDFMAIPLSELKEGQRGKVVKVASKGTVRRRIMEMGVITGAEILVKGFAPLGDPMELGIKGYSLSLRKSEAAGIFVEVL